MFELFGEMDSYEEINQKAAQLLTEGDLKGLQLLAAENGLPTDLVRMYEIGSFQELTDVTAAAIGKIEVEEMDLKPEEIMKDWAEGLKTMCLNDDYLCEQVRKKGKSLAGCFGALVNWMYYNQEPVSPKIMKAARIIDAGGATFGIPSMRRAEQIMRDYYLT